jgi:hypothetical protein
MMHLFMCSYRKVPPMPPSSPALDPFTMPHSHRLDELRTQGRALGDREDVIRNELRDLYQDLHAFNEDPRPGREVEIEFKQGRARVLEAEKDMVHDEHTAVRRQAAEERETLSGPLKTHLRQAYRETLRDYLATIQAALSASQRCHDVVSQALLVLGAAGATLPSFHRTLPLAAHAREMERWLAQEDGRYV